MTENNMALSHHQPTTTLSVFDTSIFDQMGMIACKLAQSTLVPDTLKGTMKNKVFTPFPLEQVEANCFRVVEQAHRWGMSPFAVIDGASVVHGKLMWEGKVIAAALDVLTGVRLNYEYSGSGENRAVKVSGTFKDEDKPRTIEGCVKDWKTDQWKGSAYDQRLAYRGAREWARRHAPGAIMGVAATDDFDPYEKNINDKTTVVYSEAINPFEKTSLPETKKEPEPPKKEPEPPKKEKVEQENPCQTFRDLVTQSGIDPMHVKAALIEMKALKEGQKLEDLSPTRQLAIVDQWERIEMKAQDLAMIAAEEEGGIA